MPTQNIVFYEYFCVHLAGVELSDFAVVAIVTAILMPAKLYPLELGFFFNKAIS